MAIRSAKEATEPLDFEGLAADRGKEDAVERKGVGGRGGQAQMSAVDGVECAAEEGYAHSDHVRAVCGQDREGLGGSAESASRRSTPSELRTERVEREVAPRRLANAEDDAGAERDM